MGSLHGQRDGKTRTGETRMNTAFVLMAQYNGLAIISLEQICAD